jgi:hypothetical protein
MKNKKQHKFQMQKKKKITWTQRTEGGVNSDPCGSCPLQPSSNLHNPLTLEPNLQTHMLAYANAKINNPMVEYRNNIALCQG